MAGRRRREPDGPTAERTARERLAVLVLSTTRLAGSDAGVSSDVAGLHGAWSRHVLGTSQVLEVRRGTPPADRPESAQRGCWWPGRTPASRGPAPPG
ncbi:hypothetical protein SAMN05660350_00360 [Geodermatophilus obscurus]|uniref:Uncharacterized protein n=1 Tax=Geodermatophilus obscurus TaxID=1861 RepID=A0A1M7S149_9ACTN|nr:hypothetical protein [Geodermatophilus obscurus]SHN52233.1 hypothetical protein SAMN05660350_00360 [Geodermatophilus obscurus]